MLLFGCTCSAGKIDCGACRHTPLASARGSILSQPGQPPACVSFLDECHPASSVDVSHVEVHVALAVAWWQM